MQKDHFPSSCFLQLPWCLLQIQGNILQEHPYCASTNRLIPDWCDWLTLKQSYLIAYLNYSACQLPVSLHWISLFLLSLVLSEDSAKQPALFLLSSTFSLSHTQPLSHPALLYPYISLHIYILGSVPSSVIKKSHCPNLLQDECLKSVISSNYQTH